MKNEHQYQGAFSDFEEELDWNDFDLRTYDPQIGCWLQQDPYDEFSSPYVGMGNDPVNVVDPDGGSVYSFIAGLFKDGSIGCPTIFAAKAGFRLLYDNLNLAVNGFQILTTTASINADVDFISKSALVLQQKVWLVGVSKRSPGKNADGSVAEDMISCDHPSLKGLGIDDDLANKSNDDLFKYMTDLFEWVSKGKLERVAKNMINKFRKNDGGEFTDGDLNNAVKESQEFNKFAHDFKEKVNDQLKVKSGDINKVDPINLTPPNFSSFYHKYSGLGITIHDFWSGKAEVVDYKYDSRTGHYSGTIVFTFFDGFGLDKADVEKNKDRWLIPPNGGRGFKAWYLLEHDRCFKPFITKVTVSKSFYGSTK